MQKSIKVGVLFFALLHLTTSYGMQLSTADYKQSEDYKRIKQIIDSSKDDDQKRTELWYRDPIHSAEILETWLLHQAIKHNAVADVKNLLKQYGDKIVAKSGHGQSTLPYVEVTHYYLNLNKASDDEIAKNIEIQELIKQHGGTVVRNKLVKDLKTKWQENHPGEPLPEGLADKNDDETILVQE